jgi:hypothetical protein
MGNSSLGAQAIATTTRSRSACALPVAIPTCRPTDPITGEDFIDQSDGSFVCPLGYKSLTFTSGSSP